MATIEFDDPKYHVEITSTSPIALVSPDGGSTVFTLFMAALAKLDTTPSMQPTTLAITVSGADFNYEIDFADSRFYNAKLREADHKRQITSTSFFTLAELMLHNPVIETAFGLLDATATKVEVTWVP